MKTIILLILAEITFCFYSCSSPQSKAELAVKQYLNKVLHDPRSYEPVEFSKVDSVFEPYTVLPSVKVLLFKVDSLLNIVKAADKDLDWYQSQAKEQVDFKNTPLYNKAKYQEDTIKLIWAINDTSKNLKLIRARNKILDRIKNSYKGQLIGFKLTHTYRAKNAMSALIMTTDTFYLDTNYSVLREKRVGLF